MKIVLMGGGLDSTAALIHEANRGSTLSAVHFKYGQMAFEREAESVQHFCRRYVIPLKKIDVPIHDIATSKILTGSRALGTNKLEGRNAIFVAMATTWAATIGASSLVLGYHEEPPDAPFPDATERAVEGMQRMIDTCYSSDIRLEVPFANWSRTKIARYAAGIDPDFLTHTHSCYTNIHGGCGVCVHCQQLKVIRHNIETNQDEPLPVNA